MPTKATKTQKATTEEQKPSLKSRTKAVSNKEPVTKASSSGKAPKSSQAPSNPKEEKQDGKEPVAPAETLSLIDEKQKQPRKKTTKPAPASFSSGSSFAKTGAAKKEPSPLVNPVLIPEEIPVVPGVADASPTQEEPDIVSDEPELQTIHLKPPIIVKDLAAALGLKSFQLIHDLMEMNIFASINQNIEPEVAVKICLKHGFVFEKERREKGGGVHKAEVVVAAPAEPEPQKDDELEHRAPIVTMMGHVDHGKTSLLDSIRKARVASGEAGGITQHIGAYSVSHDGNKLTFLDTPGHAAFTAMRARGANVTDIVILVVAADDGLMPQTIEAINHAKAAGATIIVAINKIDLPSANPDRVKQQLQEHGLSPEDWGGDTICCPVSAVRGDGISELLSMICLQAEVMELKAGSGVPARGVVIEAEVEAGRGPTATVIVKMGTLRTGQAYICGNQWGKIKQLIGDSGKPMKEAGPSTPVKILGFAGLPFAGDELVAMESDRAARALSEERLNEIRLNKLAAPQRATLESLFATTDSGQRKELRLVVKSDVQGSMEAILTALKDIPDTKIFLTIIHSAVGPITESDVLLASASDAVIIGFGVKVENSASGVSKREGVQIKLYSIIYELIDQVKEAMAGLLDPELRETAIGHAEVKQVFELSRGKVGGCIVIDGRIARSARARLLRRRQPIYDGGIATLRRFQDEVKEVRNGLECGIKLGDFSEYEPGDIIECYTLEKVAQKL